MSIKTTSSRTLPLIAISAIAERNPDGFTVSVKDLSMPDTGIACAYKATQNSFGIDGLKRCLLHATSEAGANYVGGWLDKKSGKYYFDSIRLFDSLKEAITFGVENEQLAVFDLTTFTEHRLDEVEIASLK